MTTTKRTMNALTNENYEYAIFLTDKTTKVYIKEL